ncbi:hypothetical protein [Sulfitobacter sp. CW3]|uniref:hypothetical protein n=1 Tax=Sulfitobacter sp. CW3 TaxID=2861965 RepID=UPI001C5F4E72|nr:hypothetical protein [Sulfitobacter sp. CW3]MBW4963857.1 hypothetical protein [Sulfitobacter sp. CW3]
MERLGGVVVKDLGNDVRKMQSIADSVYEVIQKELESLTWQDIEMSADLDTALGELDSRSTRLHGVVFERWLTIWLEMSGVLDESPETDIEAFKETIFDEKQASMTRNLLKKHRGDETPVSIAKIAEAIYDKETKGFRVTVSKMWKRVRPAIDHLGVWRVEESEGGTTAFRIWPGDVLLAFHERVYRVYRLKQIAAFVELHGHHLGAVQNNETKGN